MRLGRSLGLSVVLLVAAAVAPGACGTAGLVGGDCRQGFSACDGQCVELSSAERCGGCDTVCEAPTPICADTGNRTYRCQAACSAPLVGCSGACVDLNSDGEHCGACGAACPSAICQGGGCIGAKAGHVVALCTNLLGATETSQLTVLLGNAVFLSTEQPVKILAYAEYTDDVVQSQSIAALDWAAQAEGRTYQLTTLTEPDDVNARLRKPDFDVFLVYDQSDAPAGSLGAYGTQWNTTLDSFTHVGGVIVVLDGNTGLGEMSELLTNASLLEIQGQSDVSGTEVYVRDFGDVLGANVVSPFLASADSCVFTGASHPDDASFVVTDAPDATRELRPFAVHRFISVE